jgi:site-specific recombinase XerD
MDAIGNLSIAELKTDHIESWLDAKDWSDSTKNRAWRAVNRCFRWACRRQLMVKNPASDVEKPGPGRRENAMTEEHYKTIVAGI